MSNGVTGWGSMNIGAGIVALYGCAPVEEFSPRAFPLNPLDGLPPLGVYSATSPGVADAAAKVRDAATKTETARAELKRWAAAEEDAEREIAGIRRAKALAQKQLDEADLAQAESEGELLRLARGET